MNRKEFFKSLRILLYPTLALVLFAVFGQIACDQLGSVKGMFRQWITIAYITAPWTGSSYQDNEQALHFCRQVYDAGFTPICPLLFLSPILNDKVPQEHKDGLDMSRDFLRRSHVLVVCGDTVTEAMKNDIATAERLHITATTLDGILTVKGQGRSCGKK